jgi:hypothetical protein
MHKLAEIRSQELVCRERALSDPDHREFWLAKAEEWGQRALDEIVFQSRESDGLSLMGAAAQTTSNQSAHV